MERLTQFNSALGVMKRLNERSQMTFEFKWIVNKSLKMTRINVGVTMMNLCSIKEDYKCQLT